MTKNFLLNILLSLVWVALTGHLNYTNFLFGFILGFFILWILSKTRDRKEKEYFLKLPRILLFILLFFYDLMKANFEVAKEILTPKFKMTPGIIAYEHQLKSDFEITMFANIIALTPGTMVLKISSDKKYLFIHSLNLKDKQKFIDKLKYGMEPKLIEILR